MWKLTTIFLFQYIHTNNTLSKHLQYQWTSNISLYDSFPIICCNYLHVFSYYTLGKNAFHLHCMLDRTPSQ